MTVLGRIAPTPSGYLHEGNLYNFILTWLWIRSQNGKLLLRIDDLDTWRSKPKYVAYIFRSLENLGLDWDEGPSGPDDFYQNWSQRKRLESYSETLHRLQRENAVFACKCSRKQLNKYGNIYPNICLNRNIDLSSSACAWRVKMEQGYSAIINDHNNENISIDVAEKIGAFIVKRKDGLPSYQLASFVDDVFFKITHIVRGEDLLHSTASQMYLSKLADVKDFAGIRFWHHSLIRAMDGQKISKTAGNAPGNAGELPNPIEVFQGFAQWMGWNSKEFHCLEDLQKGFLTAQF